MGQLAPCQGPGSRPGCGAVRKLSGGGSGRLALHQLDRIESLVEDGDYLSPSLGSREDVQNL